MNQWFGAWDGRRKAITLGMISNIIGALAAAGAAVTAWISTMWATDLTMWALILAGVGTVFVAKGTLILALAESYRADPLEEKHDLQQSLVSLENRLSGRHKALVERITKLEDELTYLRKRA